MLSTFLWALLFGFSIALAVLGVSMIVTFQRGAWHERRDTGLLAGLVILIVAFALCWTCIVHASDAVREDCKSDPHREIC